MVDGMGKKGLREDWWGKMVLLFNFEYCWSNEGEIGWGGIGVDGTLQISVDGYVNALLRARKRGWQFKAFQLS